MKRSVALLLLAAVSCDGKRAVSPAVSPAAVASTVVVSTTLSPQPSLRWYAGDMHMHVGPPDVGIESTATLADVVRAATAAKLDFVVLTPHIRTEWWASAKRRATFLQQWHTLDEQARADPSITLIAGAEWTTRSGHFTVADVDFERVQQDFLASAHQLGAIVSVNHPFAVPTHIPGYRISESDLSFREWTQKPTTKVSRYLDGVEVHNRPLALANMLSRPGGKTGEAQAWAAASRLAIAEHRPIFTVGGSDSHNASASAVMWVRAAGNNRAAILDAIRRGATCVGADDPSNSAAASLQISSDEFRHAASIGESIAAPGNASLRWTGNATLYIDGEDTGHFDGSYVHATGGTMHTYRLDDGSTRCGYVYVNL